MKIALIIAIGYIIFQAVIFLFEKFSKKQDDHGHNTQK